MGSFDSMLHLVLSIFLCNCCLCECVGLCFCVSTPAFCVCVRMCVYGAGCESISPLTGLRRDGFPDPLGCPASAVSLLLYSKWTHTYTHMHAHNQCQLIKVNLNLLTVMQAAIKEKHHHFYFSPSICLFLLLLVLSPAVFICLIPRLSRYSLCFKQTWMGVCVCAL